LKWKYLLVGLLCFSVLSTGIYSAVGATVQPQSFLVEEGQEFIYNVEHAIVGHSHLGGFLFENGTLGGQFKVLITKINQTNDAGPNTDAIWTKLYYRNSFSDPWTLIEGEIKQFYYNLAQYGPNSPWYYFVPTDATALNMFWPSSPFHWSYGPNGYDGEMKEYSPISNLTAGDLNDRRQDFAWNADGVMEIFEIRNGTGTGWELVYRVVLQGPDTTWIIILIVTLPLIGVGLAVLVLYRRRKES